MADDGGVVKVSRYSISECLDMLDARHLPDPCPDGDPCCYAYAIYGPECCTCWVVVYEGGQQEPQRDVPQVTRSSMCADCAFRPGSPERRDSPRAVCGSDDLLRLVYDHREVFACHDGLRRAIGWSHPNGLYVPHAEEDGVVAYSPPIEGRVAYRLDGTPALHCAGLAAARRAKEWTP